MGGDDWRSQSLSQSTRLAIHARGSYAIGAQLILIEAAVESLESALAAERAGVDRLELCANLGEGGTTPSAGLIAAVVDQIQLPVLVMIRPRGGGFVYSDTEIDAMTRDIELAGNRGIAGIVTGALTADGRVASSHTSALVDAAAGLPVTFHRAFDSAGSLTDTLERLIDIGVRRVLTSGAAPTALEGAATIASLVDQARERIAIIAGGGIRERNVRELISRTGVREVHSRLVDEMSMRGLVDVVRANAKISS